MTKQLITSRNLEAQFLLTALAINFIFFCETIATWTSPEYVDSLNLPPEADSLGIPIFGGILLSMISSSIALAIFFALRHATKLRQASSKTPIKINKRILFSHIKAPHLSVLRVLVLLSCLFVLVVSFIPFHSVAPLADIFFTLRTFLSTLACLILFTRLIGITETGNKPK